MKLVYICSPYAGDIESNVGFAKAACHYAMRQGCAPVAVHLLYPQFLDDATPSEREAGIRMGLRVLAACEELWVCGTHISSGMRQEIAEAKRLGIPIRYVTAAQIQGGADIKQRTAEAGQHIKGIGASCHLKEMERKPEETPSAGLTLRL